MRSYRVLNRLSWILTHRFRQKSFVPEIWHYLLAMTILIAFSQQKTLPAILYTTGNETVCEALATAKYNRLTFFDQRLLGLMGFLLT